MMNDTLLKTISLLREIYYNSGMKTKRSFGDFFSDKLISSSTEPRLLSAVNCLSMSVDCNFSRINSHIVSEFIRVSAGDGAPAVLSWIREYPQIATMMCVLKKTDLEKAIESIDVGDAVPSGCAHPMVEMDLQIDVKCLSPLSHGSDVKAGNATIFRRMKVLSDRESVLSLPYYAGNAVRGQVRDLLADDFLTRIGLIPRRDFPPIELWFFHMLYSGGSLEEKGAGDKALGKILGNNGASRAEGFYTFRNTLPGLSVLGCAIGNRILSGRTQFSDLRPVCHEWGNGDLPVDQLFEWIFLTRREDYESHTENTSMIAVTECLKAGVKLSGGINVDRNATGVERSAISHGLGLLVKRGMLGAENRRGVGLVEMQLSKASDPSLYVDFIEENKGRILSFMDEIGALKCVE